MGMYDVNMDYPPIQVCGRNAEYAREMLGNIGSCNSEMSAVSLYLFNSLIMEDEIEEVSKCFAGISMVEMHHLQMFGKLATMLGAQPRLWDYSCGKMVYWTPECNQYPCQLKPLLFNAIDGEEKAIRKYQCQADCIKDPNIVAVLRRIIMDEEHHIEIFKDLLNRYVFRGRCMM